MSLGVVVQVPGVGCPAYALLSYGVASRCQEKETLKLKRVGVKRKSPSEAKRQRGTLKPQSLSKHRTFSLTIRGGMLTSAFLDFATHSARLDGLGEMDGL